MMRNLARCVIDRIHHWHYQRTCRMCQEAMPGMASTFEPMPYAKWRASDVYFPTKLRWLLWPAKIGGK